MWTERKPSVKETTKRPGRATWAAVALSLLSVAAQVTDVVLVKVDLLPIRDALQRIEQRLEDHERRLRRLEDGESQMGEPQPAHRRREDPKRRRDSGED